MEDTIKNKPSKREIVIGVTGHRWIKETREIHAAIDQVITKIFQIFPDHRLKVLSPLAEGADRVVAKRLLHHQGTKLTAILPMPLENYLADFPSDKSKMEIHQLLDQAEKIIELPHSASREDAYAAAGRYTLDHCDLLVAMWDGQVAKGRGGTGEIVHLARERALPMAWIQQVQQDRSSGEGIHQDEPVDRIRFERFWPRYFLPDDGEE